MPAPTKPSVTSDWKAALSSLTAPTNSKQAAGFAARRKVPYNWLDWDFWLGGKWQKYTDGLVPWALFQGLGSLLLSDAAAALTSRINFWAAPHATSTRTHLFSTGLIGAKSMIFYTYSSDSLGRVLEIVHNAEWTGTEWSRVATGTTDSSIFRISYTGAVTVERRPHASSDTWADNAWSPVVSTDTGGTIIAEAANINGNAVIDGNVVVGGQLQGSGGLPVVTTADLTVGDDCTVTDDLSVGGDASVAGFVECATIDCNGTAAVGVDLLVGDDIDVGGDASVDGEITAGSGIFGTEHIARIAGFDGSTGEATLYFFEASFGAIAQKLYRQRAGEIKKIGVHVSGGGADMDLDFSITKVDTGAVQTALDSFTVQDGDHYHGRTVGDANYNATDYLRVKVAVDGGGTLGSPVDIYVNLGLVE